MSGRIRKQHKFVLMFHDHEHLLRGNLEMATVLSHRVGASYPKLRKVRWNKTTKENLDKLCSSASAVSVRRLEVFCSRINDTLLFSHFYTYNSSSCSSLKLYVSFWLHFSIGKANSLTSCLLLRKWVAY